MTARPYLMSVKSLEEDPEISKAKKKMFKAVSPLLGCRPEALREAFENLELSIKEFALLDQLMSQVGPDALACFVDKENLPAKNKVRDIFFEDVRRSEDPFGDDNDEDNEGGSLELSIEKLADIMRVNETLRFPKLLMFFWYLKKHVGEEVAENLLRQSLYTMAIYKLLSRRCVTKQAVTQDTLVQALHPAFKAILNTVKIEAKSKPDAVNNIRAETREQVGLPQVGAASADAAAKKKAMEVQYYAVSLLDVATYTKVAKQLLAASPKTKKLT